MPLKASRSAKGPKSTFKYRRRSPETWRARAQESAGNFDRFVKDSVDRFSPHDGQNKIRIFPPTWEDEDDWAYRIYVHYGVGPDEQTYLCPKEMEHSDWCPVCDEVVKLMKDGDADDAKRIRVKQRKACWLVDRKDRGTGPKFWAAPFTVARDINVSSEDEDGEILELDNPDEGYDVIFTKEGSRDRTQYIGVKLARKPSPISDDEDEQSKWLEYIEKNPIPSVLKIYDPEYIAKVFGGKVVSKGKTEDSDDEEDEDDEDEKPRRSRLKERGKAKAKVEDDDDEDEDEDDEEEQPRRSRVKRKAKLDPDDDDDDDDEDDDDEDKEPAPRRGRVKAKPDPDDDEDEDEENQDDDDDEDDDEGEAPRAKSSVGRRLEQASKRAGRKK